MSEATETSETSEAKQPIRRFSSFLIAIVFVLLALSIIALMWAFDLYGRNPNDLNYMTFMMIGLIGLALSTYMLLQTRKKVLQITLATQPVTTTILCQKCGFKNLREFQRGDYIFKEAEPCPRCNEKTTIASIIREVKEKERIREERL